ncbi:hypothetical protein [Paenibacillus chibensis]
MYILEDYYDLDGSYQKSRVSYYESEKQQLKTHILDAIRILNK